MFVSADSATIPADFPLIFFILVRLIDLHRVWVGGGGGGGGFKTANNALCYQPIVKLRYVIFINGLTDSE